MNGSCLLISFSPLHSARSKPSHPSSPIVWTKAASSPHRFSGPRSPRAASQISAINACCAWVSGVVHVVGDGQHRFLHVPHHAPLTGIRVIVIRPRRDVCGVNDERIHTTPVSAFSPTSPTPSDGSV